MHFGIEDVWWMGRGMCERARDLDRDRGRKVGSSRCLSWAVLGKPVGLVKTLVENDLVREVVKVSIVVRV